MVAHHEVAPCQNYRVKPAGFGWWQSTIPFNLESAKAFRLPVVLGVIFKAADRRAR